MESPLLHSGDAKKEDQLLEVQDELQLIKAKTMFRMVQELPGPAGGSSRKLLFLTNKQASLLASSGESISKLLDALELPRKPRLVIHLLMSMGFSECTGAYEPWEGGATNPIVVGFVHGRGPFATQEEEAAAIERVDHFMANTLIPLAVQTNAIIITSAIPQWCVLTSSLLRVVALNRASWQGEMPFSIISFLANGGALYRNHDPSAHWREVKKQSLAWGQRDGRMAELAHKRWTRTSDPISGNVKLDLDPQALCVVLVDSVDEKSGEIGRPEPGNRLKTEILRHLACTLPSISIQTGHTDKVTMQTALRSASGLGVASEAMLSGSPLLFLDVRDRQPLSVPDGCAADARGVLIEEALRVYDEHCDALVAAGVAETMDTCSLSWFHSVLYGDADTGGGGEAARLTLLCDALAVVEGGGEEEGGRRRASAAEAQRVATHIAQRLFADGRALVPAAATLGECREQVFFLKTQLGIILQHENFYDVNLRNTAGASRLIRTLVRLDRLPPVNPPEGLRLLRQAWRRHDVAVHLAGRYKRLGKTLFLLQLLVAWLIVAVSTAGDAGVMSAWGAEPDTAIAHTVFALSLLVSLLYSVDSIVQARARWQALRAAAGEMESIVWRYRTRVGAFATDKNAPGAAEWALNAAISAWSDSLTAAANLATTDLVRDYPPAVFRHHQDAVSRHPPLPPDVDDFQRPAKPELFIQLRLRPAIEFYRCRVPVYHRWSLAFRAALLLCGVAASALAHYRQTTWVVVVTALASAVTSWSEGADTARKLRRYTEAVTDAERLLLWWDTLGEVDRAGVDNVRVLIEEGEAAINNERIAWQSTAAARTAGLRLGQDRPTTREGGDVDGKAMNGAAEREVGSRSRVHPL